MKNRRKQSGRDRIPMLTDHQLSVLSAGYQTMRLRDGTEITFIESLLKGIGKKALGVPSEGSRSLDTDVPSSKLFLGEFRQASAAFAHVLQWINEHHIEIEREFALCLERGVTLPDISPHPDHIRLASWHVFGLTGPTDRMSQKAWELLKFHIRSAAAHHAECRRALAAKPDDPELQAELAAAAKWRRKLMRQVPKGWNWREKTLTCDTDAASLVSIAEEFAGVTLSSEERAKLIPIYQKHALLGPRKSASSRR